MADFLIKVAEEAQKYPGNPDNQWYYLGGHLRNCKCSTAEAPRYGQTVGLLDRS
jgi:hypothetical protein